jgi:hypothetical protein
MRPSRSENNIGESSHSAVLSMPHNDVVRRRSYQPHPAPQPYGDPGIPRAYEATTSFLAGASRFKWAIYTTMKLHLYLRIEVVVWAIAQSMVCQISFGYTKKVAIDHRNTQGGSCF